MNMKQKIKNFFLEKKASAGRYVAAVVETIVLIGVVVGVQPTLTTFLSNLTGASIPLASGMSTVISLLFGALVLYGILETAGFKIGSNPFSKK